LTIRKRVLARLYLFPFARRTPICDRYRATATFVDDELGRAFDVYIVEGPSLIEPGQTAVVQVAAVSDGGWDQLVLGARFHLHEGRIAVACCEVLEVAENDAPNTGQA
jgi:hypothetical protein